MPLVLGIARVRFEAQGVCEQGKDPLLDPLDVDDEGVCEQGTDALLDSLNVVDDSAASDFPERTLRREPVCAAHNSCRARLGLGGNMSPTSMRDQSLSEVSSVPIRLRTTDHIFNPHRERMHNRHPHHSRPC